MVLITTKDWRILGELGYTNREIMLMSREKLKEIITNKKVNKSHSGLVLSIGKNWWLIKASNKVL
jgi:hypothetical protein